MDNIPEPKGRYVNGVYFTERFAENIATAPEENEIRDSLSRTIKEPWTLPSPGHIRLCDAHYLATCAERKYFDACIEEFAQHNPDLATRMSSLFYERSVPLGIEYITTLIDAYKHQRWIDKDDKKLKGKAGRPMTDVGLRRIMQEVAERIGYTKPGQQPVVIDKTYDSDSDPLVLTAKGAYLEAQRQRKEALAAFEIYARDYRQSWNEYVNEVGKGIKIARETALNNYRLRRT